VRAEVLVNDKLSMVMLSSALALAACDSGEGSDDGQLAETSSGDGDGDTSDSNAGDGDGDEPAPVDSDEDGLTDDEEAELGTDPLDKDTDDDNYWDSWEIIEGTDPLSLDSRIYTGFWPYNPSKDALPQGTWAAANTEAGSQFPRQSFLDQHGDSVDIYDFGNFTNPNGEITYLLIDQSAQWCGPCHIMAEWIAGVDNSDTAPLQQMYPSVREKIHTLRIWWITIIAENSGGGPPSLSDAQSWATTHHDPYIPVLVDDTQQVRDVYNGGQFPWFFLISPSLAIEFWKIPGPNDNAHPALWMVQAFL
jgi:hypothetical protein